MKILLIGHEGYVGAGLFHYLSQHHQVMGWGRQQDICHLDASILEKLKISAVVNCAAIIERTTSNFVIDSESDRVNVGGARALVSALADKDIKLIQISTKDVFGKVYSHSDVEEEQYSYKPTFLVDDSQPFAPETIYAKTKLMSEFIVESHPRSVVIRLASCYTDFDHYRGNWVVNIIKTLLQNKPVTVTNTGKQFRDLLNSDDLGRLIERVLESEHYGVKLNAGGGADNIFSILQVIRMIDSNAQIIESDGDDYGFAFNNRLANELFDWQPRISFTSRLPVIRENIVARRTANV